MNRSVTSPFQLKAFAVMFLAFAISLNHAPSHAGEIHVTEYEIKAVCLYKFLQYIRWPDDHDRDGPVIIGIAGADRFGHAFDTVDNTFLSSGRRVEVRRYGADLHPDSLRSCAILFIDSSERERFQTILDMLNSAPTLTVGDTPGFLEAGGMFNFLLVENRIRWEINRAPLDRAGLRPHAQIFSSAIRVVDFEEGL